MISPSGVAFVLLRQNFAGELLLFELHFLQCFSGFTIWFFVFVDKAQVLRLTIHLFLIFDALVEERFHSRFCLANPCPV